MMAYDFNGSTQYISATASPLGTGQLGDHTISFWLNGATGTAFGISRSTETTGVNNPAINIQSGTGTGQAFYRANSSPAGLAYLTTDASNDGFVSGTWKHFAVRLINASSAGTLNVYVDGAFEGSQAYGSAIPTVSGMDRLGIAALVRGNVASYFTGSIAEVGVWDVALPQAEITCLGKGFKPPRIRPQSLVFYAPIVRNVQDVRKGLALTNNNSASVVAHPRTI